MVTNLKSLKDVIAKQASAASPAGEVISTKAAVPKVPTPSSDIDEDRALYMLGYIYSACASYPRMMVHEDYKNWDIPQQVWQAYRGGARGDQFYISVLMSFSFTRFGYEPYFKRQAEPIIKQILDPATDKIINEVKAAGVIPMASIEGEYINYYRSLSTIPRNISTMDFLVGDHPTGDNLAALDGGSSGYPITVAVHQKNGKDFTITGACFTRIIVEAVLGSGSFRFTVPFYMLNRDELTDMKAFQRHLRMSSGSAKEWHTDGDKNRNKFYAIGNGIGYTRNYGPDFATAICQTASQDGYKVDIW